MSEKITRYSIHDDHDYDHESLEEAIDEAIGNNAEGSNVVYVFEADFEKRSLESIVDIDCAVARMLDDMECDNEGNHLVRITTEKEKELIKVITEAVVKFSTDNNITVFWSEFLKPKVWEITLNDDLETYEMENVKEETK